MPKRNIRPPHVRPKARHPAHVDSLDAMLASCRKIQALAELLFCSGPQGISPQAMATTGGLIADELEKLREELAGLQRQS